MPDRKLLYLVVKRGYNMADYNSYVIHTHMKKMLDMVNKDDAIKYYDNLSSDIKGLIIDSTTI